MIKETTEIKINNKNAQYYRDLGYNVPKGTKQGTVLEIQTKHLSPGSKVLVTRICDDCKKEDLVVWRDTPCGKYCIKCSNKGSRNSFYGKKHTKKTLNKISNTKSNKDYSDITKKISKTKKTDYALSKGYSSSESLETSVIEYLEKHRCGVRNSKFLKTVGIGRQAALNIVTRLNRLDLKTEASDIRKQRLVESNEKQLLEFAKSQGFDSREAFESAIVEFFDREKIPPFTELAKTKFPNISATTISKILVKNGRSDLINTTQSSLELDLEEFLNEILDKNSIIKGSRKVIPPYELDLYIPDKNIAIEVNGLYWHSEIHKDKKYHMMKRELCEQQGIFLLQINSDEWLLKRPIVESILKAKLEMADQKIFARKCEIRKVSRLESELFCEENHLMGSARGSSAVGLYHEDVLVSLLTYKKLGTGLDISRFCNKLGILVVGGLGKLLKTLKDQNPEFIQSFVDLRYGTGSSLKTLDFVLEKITLGWKWTDFTNTYNRLKCRANMDDRGLSEAEHAEELGLTKIYDAGQAKWIWKP